MTEPPPTIWQDVFRKAKHTFTEKEKYDANYSDLAPLAQHCPDFWEVYETMGNNSKKLESIWEMEWEWTQAVQAQDYPKAKKLFRILQKTKVSNFK